jgi:hypothetical protein
MFPRRTPVLVMALAGAVGGPLAISGVAGAATRLEASLSGQKEVPKAGNGTGRAEVTLRPNRRQICFRITLRRVGVAAAGHIHKGGPSTAGPITVPLFEQPTRRPRGCASAQRSVIRAIRRNPSRYYVNVHTATYPAGAARGQLSTVPR